MAQITKAEATAANQLNSPLLRLPAELRNLIYHYALGNCTLSLVPSQKSLRLFQRDMPAFPLLAVCTQIQSEAALLPYILNTWDIANRDTLYLFLEKIHPRYIQAIKKLDIGPWTVALQSTGMICAWLEKFKGLEEVVFSYDPSFDQTWIHDWVQRWERVVTLMRERLPLVGTATRDSREGVP
ncbi:hypothetical protein J4E93_004266 [Alternaria ventricosa]|uniref:uncharacterized protein n=1 Tax=Alternaria ventricosa TaxID=1187951 RepID=UPI0020C1E1EC|nr:uncharacterized protein J4E93_004266 [Alternaria ventricosa]KAI4647855.1 hypothetical protein J4E93_004266 [Alternaria ventricosa]